MGYTRYDFGPSRLIQTKFYPTTNRTFEDGWTPSSDSADLKDNSDLTYKVFTWTSPSVKRMNYYTNIDLTNIEVVRAFFNVRGRHFGNSKTFTAEVNLDGSLILNSATVSFADELGFMNYSIPFTLPTPVDISTLWFGLVAPTTDTASFTRIYEMSITLDLKLQQNNG